MRAPRLQFCSALLLASLLVALSPLNGLGAAGSLDPTFGQDGIVFEEDIYTNALAIQPDGKIVIAGNDNGSPSGFLVVRYNVDGSLDGSFGGTGKVATKIGAGHAGGSCLAVQSNGKIVVGGSAYRKLDPNATETDFVLVRYNTNGSLDTGFGAGGKVVTPVANARLGDAASAVLVQSDGKIVLAGTAYPPNDLGHFAVVRYNENGSLDSTFGSGGKATTLVGGSSLATTAVIQSDGKIVLAGIAYGGRYNDFALVRYNANGTLDSQFGAGGKVITSIGHDDFARRLLLQPDGKLVLAGYTPGNGGSSFATVRYATDGNLDESFNGSGMVITDLHGYAGHDRGLSAVLQNDGKIVVAGESDGNPDLGVTRFEFALVRYNPDGALDRSFNGRGIVTTDIVDSTTNEAMNDVALQSDSKIVVLGRTNTAYSSTVAIARYEGVGASEPEPTPIPRATPLPGSIVNISTRLGVGNGDDVLIAGFILQGIAPKKIVVRAIGPSLRGAGVSGVLEDPTLELYNSDGARIAANDNWKSTQQDEIIATTIAPTEDSESAIVATLSPGAYTAVLSGVDGTTGIALVEVYDLNISGRSRAVNISTRGVVGSSDDVMIVGFIVHGHRRRMVIRAIGPSLGSAGVQDALADPQLEVFADSQSLASNDNWADGNDARELNEYGLAPAAANEAVVVLDLEPGAYTAVVQGASGSTGIAVVEAYDISVNPTGVSHFSITDPASPATDFVFENSGGGGMLIEGNKNPDGTVSKVEKVILSDSDSGTSALVSFNAEGLVGGIETSTGEIVSFFDYDLNNLTATLYYLDPGRDVSVGPVVISILPDSETLRHYVLSGQFATSDGTMRTGKATTAAAGKSFWESRIGKIIGGTIGVAAAAVELARPKTLILRSVKSAVELTFGLYELGGGVTERTAPQVIQSLSPLVDALSCGTEIAVASTGVGAYLSVASALISCSKTANYVLRELASRPNPADPSPGHVQFSSAEVQVTESQTMAILTVERLGGSAGEVTGSVNAISGTARPGEDYIDTLHSFRFADGDTAPKDILIPIVDDDLGELPGDHVDFSIIAVQGGAAIGKPRRARVNILDDDRGAAKVAGSELVIEYTWPAEQKDLDTATTFLGGTVGYSVAPSAPYMSWSNDDTSTGGTEIVRINIGQAALDGVLPSSFQIDLKAGWYSPSGGSGPATLNVYARPKSAPGDFVFPTRRPIFPGSQTAAATRSVGSVVFRYSSAIGIYAWSWE